MDFRHDPDTDFSPIEELDEQRAKQEIEALREGIDYHDYRYYVKADPVVADATYDKLLARLEELEEHFPQFDHPASPTKRVGAKPADEFPRVDHLAAMLSLNAAHELEEVVEFDDFVARNLDGDAVTYVAEPKFDGFSIEIVYRDGIFERGSTRGDGYVGEDITQNVRTIRSVPMRLQNRSLAPELMAVRGEVFMPRDEFQKMNKRRVECGEEPFANPRNAAAGTMRQLDSNIVARRPMDIVFFDLMYIDGGPEFSNHCEVLEAFRNWGLKTSFLEERCDTVDELRVHYDALIEDRETLNCEIDGLVIKIDDFGQRERLGARHRSPRWALAWKFPARKEVTILRDIVLQVGRTGKLTPVGLLEPVDVGGVTVSRASLHNADEVERKDLRGGDRVRIARAGDVIPQVVERIERTEQSADEPFVMPDRCPVCDTEIITAGAYHLCPAGLSCPAQRRGRLEHWASRAALDIEGLGEKTVALLVDQDLVDDPSDLYELTVDDILNLDGFAEKSATNLIDEIEATKHPELDRFIYALGIHHVGERVATVLARHFGDLDSLIDADAEQLEQIHEIGPEIADSIAGFFDDEMNRRIIDRLRDAGMKVQTLDVEDDGGALEDKTFVFTGALENFTRSDASSEVERRGGRVTSSVSGNTDYLVVGDNPGSKLDQARERGVDILDEEAFRELIDR